MIYLNTVHVSNDDVLENIENVTYSLHQENTYDISWYIMRKKS